MIDKKLYQNGLEALSTRSLETLVPYLGYSPQNELYENRTILYEPASVDSGSLVFGRI